MIYEIMKNGKFWMIIMVGQLIVITLDITIKLIYMVTNANLLIKLILRNRDPSSLKN